MCHDQHNFPSHFVSVLIMNVVLNVYATEGTKSLSFLLSLVIIYRPHTSISPRSHQMALQLLWLATSLFLIHLIRSPPSANNTDGLCSPLSLASIQNTLKQFTNVSSLEEKVMTACVMGPTSS